MGHVPLLVVGLLLPLLLTLLLLAMEWVERPLARAAESEQLVAFLDSARPEEVEAFISQGYGPALERYWRRRGPARPSSVRAR